MENQSFKAVLFDFDNTLFETAISMPYRKAKPKPDWDKAYSTIPDCPLYQGWETVLSELNSKGIPMGIVSGCTKGFIERTLRYNKLSFEPIVGGYVCRRKQPKIKLFPTALQHPRFQGIDRSEILYLGDEARDVEQANEFGLQSAACFWGTEEAEKLAATTPTYKLYRPDDLLGV